jgi:hypothetical protein
MITTSPHRSVHAETQPAPGELDTPRQPLRLAEEALPPLTPLRLLTTARYPDWMGVTQTSYRLIPSAEKIRAREIAETTAKLFLDLLSKVPDDNYPGWPQRNSIPFIYLPIRPIVGRWE